MNLHYSQTKYTHKTGMCKVLLPYEFTLLSNLLVSDISSFIVLLPYEFTLLSNKVLIVRVIFFVLLPYEFTLLSNLK